MKSTGQKLKKLKTRQVYGFRKDQLNGGYNNGDPTTLTTLTTSHVALNGALI
jgi:hypothetical protein